MATNLATTARTNAENHTTLTIQGSATDDAAAFARELAEVFHIRTHVHAFGSKVAIVPRESDGDRFAERCISEYLNGYTDGVFTVTLSASRNGAKFTVDTDDLDVTPAGWF